MNRFIQICLTSLAIVWFLPACNKVGEDAGPARLMVINVSPNTPTAGVSLVRGNNINTYNIAYNKPGNYTELPPAAYRLLADSAGVAPPGIQFTTNLVAGGSYSLFLFDSLPKIQLAIATDWLALPPDSIAHLRFFNFAANGASLGVVLAGATDTLAFSPRGFANQSNIGSMDEFSRAASTLYDLYLVSGNTVVFTQPNVQFRDKGIYTLYATGAANAAPPYNLRLEVLAHN